MPRVKIRNPLFWLPIALTTLAFGVMIFVFPYFSDDLWYLSSVREWFLGIDSSFPWASLKECWRQHYMTDNLRLSNITFTFLMLAPRWIGALLSTIAISANILLLCRLSTSPNKFRPAMAVWICLLYSAGLPWLNEQAALNYACNYVWSGALALFTVLMMLSARRPRLWAAALLGLLCGAWHEGFGVPVACGAVALMAFRPKKYLTPKNIAITAGIAAGTLYLLTCPGTLSRGRLDEFFSLSTFVMIIPRHTIMWLFLTALAAAYCVSAARRRLDGNLLLFIVCAAAANFAIDLATHFTIRVAWCSELLSIAGTVHCGLALYRAAPGGRRVVASARAATVAAGIFLAVHLVAADVTTVRSAARWKHIISEFRRPGDGVIFADYINQYDAPFIAFSKSGLELFSDFWNLRCLRDVYGVYGHKRVVDSRLRRVTAGCGSPAPGIPGLRKLSNCFFVPDEGQFHNTAEHQIYGSAIINGRPTPRNITIVPFVSEADGRRYWQLYPATHRIVFNTPEGIIVP